MHPYFDLLSKHHSQLFMFQTETASRSLGVDTYIMANMLATSMKREIGLTPLPLQFVRVRLCRVIGSVSMYSILSYLCRRRTVT
jgi:hypothetical protein